MGLSEEHKIGIGWNPQKEGIEEEDSTSIYKNSSQRSH